MKAKARKVRAIHAADERPDTGRPFHLQWDSQENLSMIFFKEKLQQTTRSLLAEAIATFLHQEGRAILLAICVVIHKGGTNHEFLP
jgi:hypothetical protein